VVNKEWRVWGPYVRTRRENVVYRYGDTEKRQRKKKR
jgi:hypothetical protein